LIDPIGTQFYHLTPPTPTLTFQISIHKILKLLYRVLLITRSFCLNKMVSWLTVHDIIISKLFSDGLGLYGRVLVSQSWVNWHIIGYFSVTAMPLVVTNGCHSHFMLTFIHIWQTYYGHRLSSC